MRNWSAVSSTARFRIDNVDGILTMFQQIFGAKARHLPGGIVLLS